MKEYKVDMHIHTCYSDGDTTPNEIIKKAKREGIRIIAITDHDTILGNKNITLSKDEIQGITVVPGIELSAKIDKGRLHILGYGIDINNKMLNEKMIELRNNSLYSIIGLLAQLKKDYKIIFLTKDIQKLLNKEKNIGRPDLAKLCVRYGYAKTVAEAFDKYLEEAYKKTKLTNKGLQYKECIKLIKESGGIAVLAHPHTLKMTNKELEHFIKKLIKYGLEGIEVFHSNHTPEQTHEYLALALKYNLLISSGSDYHGKSVKPDINMATGKNNNLKVTHFNLIEKIKTTY